MICSNIDRYRKRAKLDSQDGLHRRGDTEVNFKERLDWLDGNGERG